MDIYQILVTHNREWTAREFLFFVIVFIVVAFCLRQLVKRDKMKGFQAYACLAALTFLAIVYASTVFTRNPQTDYHYNLDLFWSWRAVFRGSREMLKEDILNIVLLLPLGGLLPFVFDKKIRWWQILLITLLVIALIFGGAFALIMGAITPAGGNIKLNQLINTPKEFQGKEFNILVTGVDRSSTGDLSAGAANDSNVNDGMTDMILYVHFNNETGEMKMLQIPRDTMVTTDASVSGNYRINGVAKTQGSDSNNNMAALCELIADQYKLPIDGFITIRLEMLTELVDLFGGVEINVPVDVDYAALGLGDSVIHAGYQTLNGASMEFLLRARKIYPDGDIGRLNMQRQFYAALFRKLKSIGNIWDVAKLTPAVLNYMETNLSASDLISFAISMLKIDSSKIMICQMPVISGPQYNGQSLLYPARQADADLLNQYFRENTGPVDASQLNLCDNVIDLSGYTATDPNIQQMGGLMAAADDAQKNENLDGSNQVTDIMASESTAESESTDTDSTDTESQPAA